MNPINTAVQHVGGISALAKALGVTPPTVHQWLKGQRPIPAERCPAIERLTNRTVTCEALRPDVAGLLKAKPKRRAERESA